MSKKFSWIIVFVISFIVLAACGSGNQQASHISATPNNSEERVFRLGHIGGESHIWNSMINVLNEELDKNSGGRLSIENYGNAILGNEPDLMRQLQAGSLDMAMITSAELTNRSSSFNAWFMPFLLKDAAHTNQMGGTEEGQAILESLSADEGVHALGYAFVETRHLLMKNSFITGKDDLAGKKIRIIPSPVIVDWWQTLGASPTPIPLAEVYSSFQTGVIDGIEMGPMAIMSSGFYEISDSYTRVNHMMLNSVGFMSQQVWEGLSPEDQKIIEDAFEVARQSNLELSVSQEETKFQEFVDQGGEVRELEQPEEILNIAEEFRTKYAEEDELIKAFIGKATEINPN